MGQSMNKIAADSEIIIELKKMACPTVKRTICNTQQCRMHVDDEDLPCSCETLHKDFGEEFGKPNELLAKLHSVEVLGQTRSQRNMMPYNASYDSNLHASHMRCRRTINQQMWRASIRLNIQFDIT